MSSHTSILNTVKKTEKGAGVREDAPIGECINDSMGSNKSIENFHKPAPPNIVRGQTGHDLRQPMSPGGDKYYSKYPTNDNFPEARLPGLPGLPGIKQKSVTSGQKNNSKTYDDHKKGK